MHTWYRQLRPTARDCIQHKRHVALVLPFLRVNGPTRGNIGSVWQVGCSVHMGMPSKGTHTRHIARAQKQCSHSAVPAHSHGPCPPTCTYEPDWDWDWGLGLGLRLGLGIGSGDWDWGLGLTQRGRAILFVARNIPGPRKGLVTQVALMFFFRA